MTQQEWIEFGDMYDTMIDEGVIPNLITMVDEDEIRYAIYVTSEDIDFDTTLEDVYDAVTEWHETPLSAIKKCYFINFLNLDVDEIVNNLTELDVDNLIEICGNVDLNLNQILATLISKGIDSVERESEEHSTGVHFSKNCKYK